jgi:hypothetical protein
VDSPDMVTLLVYPFFQYGDSCNRIKEYDVFSKAKTIMYELNKCMMDKETKLGV